MARKHRGFLPLIFFMALASFCFSKELSASSFLLLFEKKSTVHQEAAHAILEVLSGESVKEINEFDQLPKSIAKKDDVIIIALGNNALKIVMANKLDNPFVGSLINFHDYHRLLILYSENKFQRHGMVFVDQPLERQIKLTKQLLPNIRNLGILLHQENANLYKLVSEIAGINLLYQEIAPGDNIISQADNLARRVDGMLAVPDEIVLNPRTIHGYLLNAYRRQIPVIGYSEPFVKAGAIFSAYSTPTMLGQQTGQLAKRLLEKVNEEEILLEYPKNFMVITNESIARALGLTIHVKNLEGKIFSSTDEIK